MSRFVYTRNKGMRGLLVIFFVSVFFSPSSPAQTSYITREGSASFYSSAPLENIEASNNRVQAVLNNSTGEIVVSMRIEHFRFEKALMYRHFNENYLESHKFPEATFSGLVEGFIPLSQEAGNLDVTVRGSLTVHGVSREVEIPGSLVRSGPHYLCEAVFQIRPADHDIKIPRMLVRNIAEEVQVTVKLRLAPVN